MMNNLKYLHWSTKLLLLGAVLLSIYNCYLGMIGMPATLEAVFWVVITNIVIFIIVAAIPAWIIVKIAGSRSSKGFLDFFIFVWYLLVALTTIGGIYNGLVQNEDSWFIKFLSLSLLAAFAVILSPRPAHPKKNIPTDNSSIQS